MTALLLTPVVLSLLVLGAHLLRAGAPMLVPAVLLLLGMLVVRRPWVARTVQVALVLGALEWVRRLLMLAGERITLGQPWARMAVILGVVALVTGLSALVFRTATLRRWFRSDGGAGAGSASEQGAP